MLFVIPAFGGAVSWEGEGAPFDESDQSITHQVCHCACKSGMCKLLVSNRNYNVAVAALLFIWSREGCLLTCRSC